ncbi:MAG: hypothetical protein M1438_05075, partial [Deltaproteobacteria bacterium]|nr:hypothetical protein [Deltaproteobacteria bacterium]
MRHKSGLTQLTKAGCAALSRPTDLQIDGGRGRRPTNTQIGTGWNAYATKNPIKEPASPELDLGKPVGFLSGAQAHP